MNTEKKKEVSDKNSFGTRRFKNGAYSTLLIAAAVVIVLLVNLIVGRMGITVDISEQGLYTLSEETDQVAENLKDPVTIYYIATAGTEEKLVQRVVACYDKYENVSVVTKDPLLYPNFTSQYTDSTVSDNSVIVVNETTGVSRYIPYAELLVLQLAYDESGSMYNEAVGIDAEGQITSALNYVTTEDLATLYQVSGHGETLLNETLEGEVNKLNMQVETLETISVDRVPADCDVLLLNGPAYDLNEQETAMIRDYLENGGAAILFAGYTEEETPNLEGLLEYYGVRTERGIIVEGYGYYMGQYMTYLLPISQGHEITDDLSKPVISAISQGMTILNEVRSSLEVKPILKTSDQAYLKVNTNSETFTQEEDDPSGPFVLGAAITEEYQGKETKLAVFSSSNLLHDSMVSTNQFGNGELLMSVIDWATELELSVSIPSKNIQQSYLTMSKATAGRWAIALTVVLPAALLIAGFAIWFTRRRH